MSQSAPSQAPAHDTTPGSSFADPGPLGLAAFALTTFVLNLVNSGIMSATAGSAVFGLALFYGGLGQFVAGLWEFAKGNTFGSTAFCSYGAFWMSFWYLTGHTDPAPSDKGVGAFLLGFAIFTAYMTLASLRTSMALILVFAFLTLTFLFLALGALDASTGLTKLGGYLGLITAIIAWYASAAGVTNATWGRVVLPVGPR